MFLHNVSASIRIRFSLMPQKYSDVLEPETSSIIERIQAIDKFIDKGYEVHINFSPVVVTDTWLDDYRDLFMFVDEHVTNKDKVKCEVIFLTHNEKKHNYNLANDIPGEDMLWRPEIQENKLKSIYDYKPDLTIFDRTIKISSLILDKIKFETIIDNVLAVLKKKGYNITI